MNIPVDSPLYNHIKGVVLATAKDHLIRHGHYTTQWNKPNRAMITQVLRETAMKHMIDGTMMPISDSEFMNYWNSQKLPGGQLGSAVGDVWKAVTGAATTVWHSVSGGIVSAVQFVGRNTTDAINMVSHAIDQIPVIGNIISSPLDIMSAVITQPLNFKGMIDSGLNGISTGLLQIPYVGSIVDLPIALTQDAVDKAIELSPIGLLAYNGTSQFTWHNISKMPKTGKDIIAIDQIPYIGPMIIPLSIAIVGMATGGFGLIAGAGSMLGSAAGGALVGAVAGQVESHVTNAILANQITQYVKGKQNENLIAGEKQLTGQLQPVRVKMLGGWNSIKLQVDPFFVQCEQLIAKVQTLTQNALVMSDIATLQNDKSNWTKIRGQLDQDFTSALSLESAQHGRQEMTVLKQIQALLILVNNAKTNTGLVITSKADAIKMISDTKAVLLLKNQNIASQILTVKMKGQTVTQSQVNRLVVQNSQASTVPAVSSSVVTSAVTQATNQKIAQYHQTGQTQINNLQQGSKTGSLIGTIGALGLLMFL